MSEIKAVVELKEWRRRKERRHIKQNAEVLLYLASALVAE